MTDPFLLDAACDPRVEFPVNACELLVISGVEVCKSTLAVPPRSSCQDSANTVTWQFFGFRAQCLGLKD